MKAQSLFFTLFLSFSLMAQKAGDIEPIKTSEVPTAILTHYDKFYILGCETEWKALYGKGKKVENYLASCMVDGVDYEIHYNTDGKDLFKCVQYRPNVIPETIKEIGEKTGRTVTLAVTLEDIQAKEKIHMVRGRLGTKVTDVILDRELNELDSKDVPNTLDELLENY